MVSAKKQAVLGLRLSLAPSAVIRGREHRGRGEEHDSVLQSRLNPHVDHAQVAPDQGLLQILRYSSTAALSPEPRRRERCT